MSHPIVCWQSDFQPHPDFEVPELREPTAEWLAQAEVCIGHSTTEQLAAMPRLRWLQIMIAGAERWLHVPSSIILTTANPVFVQPAAEHALAMLLALGRDLPHQVRQGTARQWTKSTVCRDLDQATVVVVGLGAIGQAIAVRASAFGARIIGVQRDPRGTPPPGVVAVHGVADLAGLLTTADAVVLALPTTSATDGLVSRTHLQQLKPGALVINVGRGSTIDQQALVDGLASGRIGGVGLDVTTPEPLPSEHPLWAFPNVLITGHSVNTSPGKARRRAALVSAQLARWRRGEALLYQVDRAKGY
ncbi:MAG TPA: D-2-hydroxyacid dehydrogenase [Planctomycetota bacterium]|nr:D-2-hydroxyacid dehydrogenase [Planctomycetota bacterium]